MLKNTKLIVCFCLVRLCRPHFITDQSANSSLIMSCVAMPANLRCCLESFTFSTMGGITKPMTDFPDHRLVHAADIDFAVYEAGPESGRPILLLHGWPELAYSWKLIMPKLAEAGYRVIAIDQKGFGNSSKPADPSQYGMDKLTADFAALIEALGYEKILICGHDWGGAMVWPMAYTFPQKVEGVIGICTPHRKRAPVAPTDIFKTKFSTRHYIVMFQDLYLPDETFGGHEEKFFRFMFRQSLPRKFWPKIFPGVYDQTDRFLEFEDCADSNLIMSKPDLNVFIQAYKKSGHQTPTHVYRNVDHNWQLTRGIDLTIHQPVLMLSAELDVMLPPETCEHMEDLCPDLTIHTLEDCGHWAMWEKPDDILRHMVPWMEERFPT